MTEVICGKKRGVRGIKRRILGVSLLSVGLLNTMLTLKAGTAPDSLNYIIVGAGIFIFCSGLSSKNTKSD